MYSDTWPYAYTSVPMFYVIMSCVILMLINYRKEGGKFGFAEHLPEDRITVLKREETPVETSGVLEMAEEIIREAEAPSEMYPYLYWVLKK